MKNIELKKLSNHIEIKINFLGGLITHARDMHDVDIAIEEAVLCFIEASKKYGNGLYQELNS